MSKNSNNLSENSSLKDLVEKYQNMNLVSTIEQGFNRESAIYVPLENVIMNPVCKEYIISDEQLQKMKDQIELNGILDPIFARKVNDKYEVISGYRRFYASKSLGLKQIPLMVRDVSDEMMIYLTLNLMQNRVGENILNKANCYKVIVDDYHITRADVALMTNQSLSQVTNIIRLLKLPKRIQSLLADKKISFGQARALIDLDKEQQERVLKLIIKESLSVRQVEDLVNQLNQNNDCEEYKAIIKDKFNGQSRILKNSVSIKFDSNEELIKFLNFIKNK